MTTITKEDAAKCELEYNSCADLFPGWRNHSLVYGGHPNFTLFARLGRWQGRISRDKNGEYRGEWSRHGKLGLFGNPEETFYFMPQKGLKELLDLLDKWIEIRRSPSTWRGQITAEKEAILLQAKSL